MGTEQINKRPKKNLADRLCPRVTIVRIVTFGGLYRGFLYSFPHETLGAHRYKTASQNLRKSRDSKAFFARYPRANCDNSISS